MRKWFNADLDPLISRLVHELNNVGFGTTGSCQGHADSRANPPQKYPWVFVLKRPEHAWPEYESDLNNLISEFNAQEPAVKWEITHETTKRRRLYLANVVLAPRNRQLPLSITQPAARRLALFIFRYNNPDANRVNCRLSNIGMRNGICARCRKSRR